MKKDTINAVGSIIFIIIGLLFLCLAGCEPAPPETSEQKEARLEQFATNELPSEAKKVMDLGNNWFSFELEVCGKNRVFLFHREGDYSGEGQFGLESITEIRLDDTGM